MQMHPIRNGSTCGDEDTPNGSNSILTALPLLARTNLSTMELGEFRRIIAMGRGKGGQLVRWVDTHVGFLRWFDTPSKRRMQRNNERMRMIPNHKVSVCFQLGRWQAKFTLVQLIHAQYNWFHTVGIVC